LHALAWVILWEWFILEHYVSTLAIEPFWSTIISTPLTNTIIHIGKDWLCKWSIWLMASPHRYILGRSAQVQYLTMCMLISNMSQVSSISLHLYSQAYLCSQGDQHSIIISSIFCIQSRIVRDSWRDFVLHGSSFRIQPTYSVSFPQCINMIPTLSSCGLLHACMGMHSWH